MSGSSVVPGLPNITETPSCLRIWRNAALPAMYAIARPMIHFFGVGNFSPPGRCSSRTHELHAHLAHASGGPLHGRVPCDPRTLELPRALQESRGRGRG